MPENDKILWIDYEKCIGCETCESVCRFTHGQPRINMTRTVNGILAPLYCRHCQSPYCLKACSRNALHQAADGAVLLSPLLCAGCETKNCIVACPFGGIFCTGLEHAVVKCDLCLHRRAVGMLPACVEMCPCGAMYAATREEIETLRSEASDAAQKKVMDHVRPPAPFPPGRERG